MAVDLELSKAARLRRKAAACGSFAANAISPEDRVLLARMQRSWLERACYQDWLDTLAPHPPAGSEALALPQMGL
jgi:hypothetical protein